MTDLTKNLKQVKNDVSDNVNETFTKEKSVLKEKETISINN